MSSSTSEYTTLYCYGPLLPLSTATVSTTNPTSSSMAPATTVVTSVPSSTTSSTTFPTSTNTSSSTTNPTSTTNSSSTTIATAPLTTTSSTTTALTTTTTSSSTTPLTITSSSTPTALTSITSSSTAPLTTSSSTTTALTSNTSSSTTTPLTTNSSSSTTAPATTSLSTTDPPNTTPSSPTTAPPTTTSSTIDQTTSSSSENVKPLPLTTSSPSTISSVPTLLSATTIPSTLHSTVTSTTDSTSALHSTVTSSTVPSTLHNTITSSTVPSTITSTTESTSTLHSTVTSTTESTSTLHSTVTSTTESTSTLHSTVTSSTESTSTLHSTVTSSTVPSTLHSTVTSTTESTSTLHSTVTSSTESTSTLHSTVTSSTVPSTLLSTITMNIFNLQLWAEQASKNQLEAAGLGVLQSLWIYVTTSTAGFSGSELPLVLYILGNITSNVMQANLQLSVDTVNKVLRIDDQLMSDMSLYPLLSLEERLGPRLLWCLEMLLPVISFTSEPLSFFYKHLDLQYASTSCDSLDDNSIVHLDATTTSISLPGDYFFDCGVSLASMTLRSDNRTFPSQYVNGGTASLLYYLASDIRTNVVMLNNWNYHVVNVNMSFTCRPRTCDQTAVCVFWDFTLEMWSSKGCVTQVTDGITQCISDHLTSFAVLMMESQSDDSYNDAILSSITHVGLCLSCLSLLLCITIQIILLRKSKNSAVYRHVSILHISSFLLIFNISFLASDLIKPDIQEQLCIAFTFSSHFSLLGFFCWTLVQGIFLVCRLVFVFHHVTKTEFLVLSIVLGYVCPLVISLGTFLVYFPHHYTMNETCWLDKSSGASMAFSVPTVIIIVVNFLILILVIHKLLRPSISEGNKEEEEVVKKLAKAVIFCTPQFGLTWAIGIPMFAGQKDLYLQYLFVLLNPLQGFFILLFACLLDKKVMDLLKKHFLRSPVTGSSMTTTSSV
ncbi:adhesion G-protein coupled receptor F1-like isoform X2 [Dendrobates tinctorius]|uniref:adhesion G-protein coupled receptor F1-like isoform X2 n=1 Tax=Dendrobates tinctorius TaxID=92724 RepID=UPI003CC9D656